MTLIVKHDSQTGVKRNQDWWMGQVIATEDAGDVTANVGGQAVTVNASDGEKGGTTSAKTIYFDVRGTDCQSNQVSYLAKGTQHR